MNYQKPKVENKSNELVLTPNCDMYCASKYAGKPAGGGAFTNVCKKNYCSNTYSK